MAERSRPSYPRLSTKAWWTIRQRFQQSLPSAVTPGYLATLFNCAEASASSNYLRPLKMLGLVNDEGKVTGLGERWRSDDDYQAVCEEIRKTTYPAELRESQPCPNPDKVAVKNWFMRTTGQGNDATEQMAAMYELLCEASVEGQTKMGAKPKPSESRARATGPKSAPRPTSPKTDSAILPTAVIEPLAPAPNGKSDIQHGSNHSSVVPSLHIDIQIHISPEASSDQIDQIFKSMATHLYRSEATTER